MKYKVNINQVYSEDVIVSASSLKEAKMKAWNKWKPKSKNYSFDVEKETDYK